MKITCRKLAKDEFLPALAVRIKVFVEEQAVPIEEEQDHYDDTATHFGAFCEDELIATARLVVLEDKGKIGRVAVLKEYRGLGVGKQLMERVLAECEQLGLTEAILGSQTHAIKFYESLGFIAEGPVYPDAGIPHRDMRKKLGKTL